MLIRLTHDGVTRDLDMSTLKIREAAQCESLTGMTAAEWFVEMRQSRAAAIQFGWYLACIRHGDSVTYTELEDVLDLMKIDVDVIADDDDEEEDTEGPTGPAESGRIRKKPASSTGSPSSDTSTELPAAN